MRRLRAPVSGAKQSMPEQFAPSFRYETRPDRGSAAVPKEMAGPWRGQPSMACACVACAHGPAAEQIQQRSVARSMALLIRNLDDRRPPSWLNCILSRWFFGHVRIGAVWVVKFMDCTFNVFVLGGRVVAREGRSRCTIQVCIAFFPFRHFLQHLCLSDKDST